MSDLNKKTIHYLTELSRIHCSEEEEEELLDQLKKILDYVELLQEVDTEHVPPCNHVLDDMANITRDDEIGELLPRETFLANAPDKISGMIKVPTIIKKT